MGELLDTNVKNYCANVRFLLDEGACNQAISTLPAPRREKALGFHFAKDRALCTGAWLLLAHAMKAEGADISHSRLQESSWGKPQIIGAPHFNLSHSGLTVMCAISREKPVGCDVQKVEPWDEALAQACMQPWELDEMRAIAARSPEAAAQAFFRRWTIKESYMKARGLGLSLPPESFGVRLCAESNASPMGSKAGAAGDAQGTAEGPASQEGNCDLPVLQKRQAAAEGPKSQVVASIPCSIKEFAPIDGCRLAACSLDPQARFEALIAVRQEQLLATRQRGR